MLYQKLKIEKNLNFDMIPPTYNYPIQVIVVHASANGFRRPLMDVRGRVHVHVHAFDGIRQTKRVQYYLDSSTIDLN